VGLFFLSQTFPSTLFNVIARLIYPIDSVRFLKFFMAFFPVDFISQENLFSTTEGSKLTKLPIDISWNNYTRAAWCIYLARTAGSTDLEVLVDNRLIKLFLDCSKTVSEYENIISSSPSTESFSLPINVSLALFPNEDNCLVSDIVVHHSFILFNENKFAKERLLAMVKIVSHISNYPNCISGFISLRVTDKGTGDSNCPPLPDPSKPFVYNFPGCIHDIFAQRVQKNPDSVFTLYQSQDKSSVETFTYSQIYSFCISVAVALQDAGVVPGDVVCVYAVRAVEMVIAVMGVLLSGATFCAIDPVYPPNRQIIYLQIAKPTALLILDGAGKLPDIVLNYIRENPLKLVMDVSLPSLLSVAVSNSQYKSPSSVGPESIATLSFTSGSTGIPKAVNGRHYSLTSFYDWMGKRFSMSSNDVFSMCSGIAHDPIQRDIFTPIYFGAKLAIPRKDDFLDLSTWMHTFSVSITHLTPAMGQVLTNGSEILIPSLRWAFFVGDILTKRDVKSLQAVAPNVSVINMYGTTETQRAVSYFVIPPQTTFKTTTPTVQDAIRLTDEVLGDLSKSKNIIPAGKGMFGVQLIVLNERKMLCGIGEIGEIYVRSCGIARGYLGIPSDKFIDNFFVGTSSNGLDRMYKTGDLGRYTHEGVVECCGREDDQVKIRGFRIELREIDLYLSQFPKIKDNITLVRRDAFEEKTLVTYYVPRIPSDDHHELITCIRDFLKDKLPTHSIPSMFIPLEKLPLTPNGKIDKNSLPFPTILKAEQIEEMSEIEKKLVMIWSKILFPSSERKIGLDENFFEVGGHSILATRLLFELRKSISHTIPLSVLSSYPTVREMAKNINGLHDVKHDLSKELIFEIPVSNNQISALDINQLFLNGSFLPSSILLTGATGFLGAFLLHEFLVSFPQTRVYCLVRSSTLENAKKRIMKNMKLHRLWNSEDDCNLFSQRVVVVLGDLSLKWLGMGTSMEMPNEFKELANNIDCVVHNGALVHWVYPYSQLKASNVDGTMEVLKLCTTGNILKPFHFISSTSVFDSEKFRQKGIIYEDDNMNDGSELSNGYGQSKWVCEMRLLEAARTLPITIIRPGYIIGDSEKGVTNSDDFIWRMCKGCFQLKKFPDIDARLNMCSVDYVAKGVLNVIKRGKESIARKAFHCWNPVPFLGLFESMKDCLEFVDIRRTDYLTWKAETFDHENALFPLLHFVTDNLPLNLKEIPLDNSNFKWLGVNMNENIVSKCLKYLKSVGFFNSEISNDMITRTSQN
jgi:L-aminoadipate-semialdehyde dehydrogenase